MPKITKKTKNLQKKLFMESLENGTTITKACKAANVSRYAIWRWRKQSKIFDQQVTEILNSRTQTVEDALFSTAISGNVTAQIFWLKNRGKERWKDKYETNENINVRGEIEITDAKEKILSRINSIAARKEKKRDHQQSK